VVSEAFPTPESNGGLKRLSHRESEVLAMASTGLTNAQMAERLEVTVHAVKFHLASIYRKLGVGNRTEAAVLFLRSEGQALEVLPRAAD
jgi:DNA-binding CsgD family transcriptional regulator